MYQKRNKMSKKWPVPRKGTKYLAVASHAKSKGIPLVFVLREILGIVKTRREARFMCLNGDVKINNRIRKDEKFPVQVFDIINLEKSGKNYRMEIKNRKFALKEVSGKDAGRKIAKIIGKKILGKDRVQMNLDDGQNFITKEKFSLGDSVIINTMEKKIEKILGLKEGANVEVVLGKHAGEKGKLKNIITLDRKKRYHIKLNEKEVNLPSKTILVIE